MTTNIRDLPVAVVGAGPVGLAVAAHLIERGVPVRVYEESPTVAASVRQWGHVRLFSPWRYNIDRAARPLLMRHGWQERNPHHGRGDNAAGPRQGVGKRTRDK